jgi:hypothetical protein
VPVLKLLRKTISRDPTTSGFVADQNVGRKFRRNLEGFLLTAPVVRVLMTLKILSLGVASTPGLEKWNDEFVVRMFAK